MNYKIINSGSDGNCTVIENTVAIDMGVSYKKLGEYVKTIQLVLLTHIHTDHFNKATIKKLASNRPTLRFGCCEWLVQELVDCGVDRRNIDVYEFGQVISYNKNLSLEAIELFHDVPQCGYKLYINDYKIIYATDTCSLENISAIDFDFYFIEGNYENEEELHSRAYNDIYESRVKATHLSKEYATEWLLKNMGFNSVYTFMHEHKEHLIKGIDIDEQDR